MNWDKVMFEIKDIDNYHEVFLKGLGANKIEEHDYTDEIFVKRRTNILNERQILREFNKKKINGATIEGCCLVYSHTKSVEMMGLNFQQETIYDTLTNGSYTDCRVAVSKQTTYQFTAKTKVEFYELSPFTIKYEKIKIEKENKECEDFNFCTIQAELGVFMEQTNRKKLKSIIQKAGITKQDIITIPVYVYLKQKLEL